jgi:hypothetical protein
MPVCQDWPTLYVMQSVFSNDPYACLGHYDLRGLFLQMKQIERAAL